MKKKNNGKQAYNCKNNETMNAANNLANLKKEKGENFGDLCWDTYGKTSVIIFGNIDDHAAELEILGGKRIEAKYSPLQNGRKWTEKMGRTTAYIFNANHKEDARSYLVNINNAIMQAALRKDGETVKPAKSYQAGDSVATIYGKGTIIESTSKCSDRCRIVRLNCPTYNYGWEGMSQTFVEVSEQDMKPTRDGVDMTAYYRRAIIEAAAMGCTKCSEFNGKSVSVKVAYKNGHNDPMGWSYCVSWYDGNKLVECENGIRLDQAVSALVQFEQESSKVAPLEQGSEIAFPTKPEAIAPLMDIDKSPSWETNLNEDDFHKLTSRYEIADEDRDIVGHRFRHTLGNDGDELEVFISDYAGNESYALVYSYEEFFDEVRCKVRSLDFLRKFYTEARGWKVVA